MEIKSEQLGLVLGFIGIVCFSLTLPATKAAVMDFDPFVVGIGRSVIASFLAAMVLIIKRKRFPKGSHFKSLCIVALGTTISFPLLTSWAMTNLSASHGGVVIGLAPLMTSVIGVLKTDESPSLPYWIATLIGSLTVVIFTLVSQPGHLQFSSFALVVAAVLVSFGYVEGAKLSKDMESWQVICWALVISCPVSLAILIARSFFAPLMTVSSFHLSACLGLFYVSVISQFLSFFAWFYGLAHGGIMRVGQLQLLQPFLTLLAGYFLLKEPLQPLSLLAAFIVVGCIAISRNTVKP